MHSFGRRRVDLDRVFHPKHPLQAFAIPNERIERGDERSGIDGPRLARVGMEISRLPPTFDLGGQQSSLLDQFRYETFGDRPGAPLRTFRPQPRRHPIAPPVGIEVTGDVAERPNAAGLRPKTDQLLHRLLARRRERIKGGPGNNALSEVVESLEAATSGDGDETAVIQMLER